MDCARVQSMAQYANSEPFETGEACVMPLLELVLLICTKTGARPPRLQAVEELEQFHLRLFSLRAVDEYGQGLAERRGEVVRESFERLRLVSSTYWQSRADMVH